MATTVFSLTLSGGTGDCKSSYGLGTASISEGSVISSGATISSATFRMSKVTIYADRGFALSGYSGWNSLGTRTSSSASFPCYTSSNLYEGMSSIYFTFLANYSGSGNSFNVRSGCVCSLTVNWIPAVTYSALPAPTGVSITPNNVGKSKSVTLSWNPSNTSGTGGVVVSSYRIYYGTTSAPTTNYYTTTSTSYTFTSPSTTGTTYYRVLAISSPSGYNSGYSSSVSLVSTWTASSAPTTLTLNGIQPPWYYGTTGNTTQQLGWSGASIGTNNTIASYSIFDGSTSLATGQTSQSYTLTIPTSTGTHAIGVKTVSGTGDVSAAKTGNLIILANANSVTFTAYPSGKQGGNCVYTWTDGTTATGATYKYIFEVCSSANGSTWGSWITKTSSLTAKTYTLDISDITIGYYFKVRVRTIAYGRDGGYTTMSTGTECYNSTYCANRFSIPASSSQYVALKDSNSTLSTALQTYGYNSIYIKWAASTAPSDAGAISGYVVQRKIGINGTFTDLSGVISPSSTLQYTDTSVGSIAGNSSIYYRIKVYDEYNVTQYYDDKYIIKREKPTVTFSNSKIGTNPNTGINLFVNWNLNSGDPTETLYCDLCLNYGGVTTALYDRIILEQGDTNPYVEELDLSIGTLKTSWLPALYTSVITNKVTTQTIGLYYKIYPSWLSTCASTGTYNVSNLDYKGKITGNLNNFTVVSATPHSEGEINYLNPNDLIQFNIPTLTWQDADGGTTGATLTYQVVRSGISPFIFTSAGTKAPGRLSELIEEDTTITYIATGILTYANNVTQSISYSYSIPRARWCYDTVKLSSVVRTDTELSGTVTLPRRCFGSDTYSNVKAIESLKLWIVNEENEPETEITGLTWDPSTLDPDVLEYHFTLETAPIPNNIGLIAVVIVSNSSDEEEDPTSPAYERKLTNRSITMSIRDTGVAFAVRKGGVGINVAKNFKNPTIANGDSVVDDPVALWINTPSNATNSPSIKVVGSGSHGATQQFIHGTGEAGMILTDSVSSDGTEYPRIFFKSLTHSFTYTLYYADIQPVDNDHDVPYFVIENKYITADDYIVPTTQEIMVNPFGTLAQQQQQINDYRAAQFLGGAQSTGSCELLIYGTQPTRDIPIKVIVRGD